MGGEMPLEPTTRGITISKLILVLSFFLPYLSDWLHDAAFQQIAVYAPTWVLVESEWVSFVGPTPMALVMFIYWLPYVYVGYQSYRFAQGKYPSTRRYVIGVILVTVLAFVFILPMMTVPRASDNGINYFSTVIPMPLVSILALLLIPFLRPIVLVSPWDNTKNDTFLKDDLKD